MTMCLNQCDYPDPNGGLCRCKMDMDREWREHQRQLQIRENKEMNVNKNTVALDSGNTATIKSFAPPLNPDNDWIPDTITDPNPTTHVGTRDAEVLAQGGTQFSTGAVRSSDKANVRYDLISPIGIRRLAETMEEGRKKYGYFNWERGMPIGDILNHAIAHIYAYLEGKPTGEDDLAHAAWGLFAAMHMEETHPNLDHQVRQTVTDNILGKTAIPKDDLDKDGQVKL